MNHTVSYKIAKALQDAGWKKRTLFCVVKGESLPEDLRIVTNKELEDNPTNYIYTPMLHEILEELPQSFEHERMLYFLNIYKLNDNYICDYCKVTCKDFLLQTESKNSHDCVAEMWLLLRASGLPDNK